MDKYYSTADMLRQFEASGWHRSETERGYRLTPPGEYGTGFTEVWGDAESHCFINSDLVFHKELMERYYYTQRGFKITFIEDMTVTYYQNKGEMGQTRFGTFCHINNLTHPRPWFHRYPAGTAQKCFSLVVYEPFFEKAGIAVPQDGWDRAAYMFNGRQGAYPELAALCMEIKKATVGAACFPIYFHGKAAQAAALLFNMAFSLEAKTADIVTHKTREAVRVVLDIINDNFVSPPVVEVLAQTVGIDKNTLQKGFRQMLGQTPREYVRALRMEKALALLEGSPLRVEDIAPMVGYQSKMHFFNAFKAIYGCTPRQLFRRGDEIR